MVQGRAGDHINRAGEKISAEEIEDHLLAHPGVFDAAVVSIPDEYLGERSCAFVIAQGEPFKAPALKAWMRGRGLAAFKVPDQVVFVDSFDTTRSARSAAANCARSCVRVICNRQEERADGAAPYHRLPLADCRRTAAARGPWRPQRDRVALLVHDMQRYFLAAFDAGNAPLRPAVDNIARLLAHCRAHGIPVFYTAQHGRPGPP